MTTPNASRFHLSNYVDVDDRRLTVEGARVPGSVGDVSPLTPDEAVEVVIQWADSARNGNYHLTAYRTPQGTVGHHLSRRGSGQTYALSNLQSDAPFPGKAVPGWQHDVVEFAADGLGTIVEVK